MIDTKDQVVASGENENPENLDSGRLSPLYSGLPVKKANLIMLILESQHIRPVIEHRDNRLTILVPENDYVPARQSIHSYYSENRFFGIKKKIKEFETDPFKSMTALFYILTLCSIHFFLTRQNVHYHAVMEFGSSALYILQGELFRVVTALMLHSDARHLVSNCAGIIIFCAPVLNLAGYGAGTLALLASGAMGNLINAYAYKTAHLSIGASTFIMSAAGLLAAYRVVYTTPNLFRKLAGLVAGATLVGMFSSGENTDVSAHIFGFISGFCIGLPFFLFNPPVRSGGHPRERLYLVVAGSILIAAWFKLF